MTSSVDRSSGKDSAVQSEVNGDDSSKAESKKPFINGIDMFADELHIGTEKYSVGLQLYKNHRNVNFVCVMYLSDNEILTSFISCR